MPTDPEFHRLSNRQKAHIIAEKFKMGDTKSSIKYSVGGLADSESYTYVSERALEWLRENMPQVVKPNGIKHQGSYTRAICIEHAVPTRLVYEHLLQLNKGGKLSEKGIEDLLEGKLACALITREEDSELNKRGLKDRMPDGRPFTECEIFARYNAAGIKIINLAGE